MIFSAIAGALGASAGAIGTAASALGTAATVAGGVAQYSGQQRAIAQQKKAEQIRMNQMEYQARNQTREIIRQQQLQRAQSLATATAQGASGEGGSALAGAEGTLSGQTGRAIGEVQDNLAFGRGIFRANAKASAAYQDAALGQTISSAGSGLTSLGNQLVNNQRTIARVGGATPDRRYA